MRRYRTVRQKRVRRVLTALFLAGFLFLVILLHSRVTALLVSVSESKLRAMASVAANDAVRTVYGEASYGDLVAIERDGAGEIAAITADSARINRLAQDCVYLTRKELAERGEEGIEVPLGVFTGLESLAGFGPSVRFRTISVAGVESRFFSVFEGAGINQTRHAIYFEITSELSVVLPSGTRTLSCASQVLVCESVIVGKVPEIYLQGSGSAFAQKF